MKTNLIRSVIAALSLVASLQAKPIQIWVSSQPDLKYYENMIKMYREKVDPKFEAEVKAFGFMEMPDKLTVAIKGGVNVPDIVQLDEIFFSMFLKGKVPFVDITDRLQSSPLGTGILPQRMGLFTWKEKIYGVPQSVSSAVLWYREDLFKEAKISINDLATWDQFEAVGKKVKNSSRYLTAMDWSYLEILLRQRGYDLFGKDGKPFADSAVIVETWKRLQNWVRDSVGVIPDRASIFEPAFFSTHVANNGIMTLIGADWYGLDIIQNMDPTHKGKWRAMPLPVWTDTVSRGRKATSSFSGQGLVIFKSSKVIEPSWKFVEWVMSDVNANVERWLQGNCFTPYKPAWSDMRFSRPDAFFGNQILSQLFMELSPSAPMTLQSPFHAMVVHQLRESFFNSVMKSTSTPEEAMKQIQMGITQMMSGKKPK